MSDEELIGGRFLVLERAAVGGMGTVYRGVDQETDDEVAIKILKRKAPLAINRFSREAALLQRLEHPRIVGFIAEGVTPGGRHYLVSEWLDGQTLKERLANQGLSVVEAIEVAKATAIAIATAHEHGFVHRDIKPSNIFLHHDDPKQTKVLDFGVARDLSEDRGLTRTGTRIGTPGYMSPEQARGQKVDERADIWSLGCVLYESLSGFPAFSARNPLATRLKVIVTTPPPITTHLPALPESLVSLLTAMLDKDPSRRPTSAALVAQVLESLDIEEDEVRRRSAEPKRNLSSEEETRSFVLHPGSRLYSVVMATGPRALEESFSDDLAERIREAALSLQGIVNFVDRRGLSCSITGSNAHECARRACSLALSVQRMTPGTVVAVSSTWENDNDPRGPDRSIEWCADHLNSIEDHAIDGVFDAESTKSDEVIVDSLTAELVSDRFAVIQRGDKFTLMREVPQ